MQEQHTQPNAPDLPDQPIMLTVDGVATLLACSPRTVYRLADNGRMPPSVKLGALVRWPRDTIDSWIAAGCPSCRNGRG